jgi:hypothetical protein
MGAAASIYDVGLIFSQFTAMAPLECGMLPIDKVEPAFVQLSRLKASQPRQKRPGSNS